MMKIGEVATRGGVSLQTIRYYERQRLLQKPPRLASGYRVFTEQTVCRIRFIKRAQELGFALAEIRDLLSMQIDPNKDCSDVQRLAKAKVGDIEEKIRTLESMKRVLTGLSELCPGCGPANECPILECIDAMEER
ncbi:MAG: heavy metal-responsive transcriptional regulator [Acidobacteria bacterium]|jgi:MerR family transcriptional regulator, copper efflux regulator|nr:heavy metal-responsive transcriptional regulator [Acidobacteriota bacterium]